MRTFALNLLIFVSSIVAGKAWAETGICSKVVQSTSGLIRGKLIKSTTGKDICAFYGIPYAQPPIGKLRFKRPVPKGKWEGIFNAFIMPNACSQGSEQETKADAKSSESLNSTISEDCLGLNLWVPAHIFQTESYMATTMVWIHGGGLSAGSSTKIKVNGAILAGDNDVVVASLQYRLGPLGFLYFGNDEAPGNMGLIDQNLALQWIHGNIDKFGGSKDEITLFGESAGAISISYHLLSPLSRGLFSRAILMSGVATSPILWWSQQEAINFSYEVAANAECWANSYEQNDTSAIMICLRTRDNFKINFANYRPKKFIETTGGVTIDGYFLTDTPENLLRTSGIHKVDLIIGAVRDEGTYFLGGAFPNLFSLTREPSQITFATFEKTLKHMFRDRPNYEREAILTHYTNWTYWNGHPENLRSLVGAAGDYSFVCPSVEFAKTWSAKQGSKVYYYWFTQRSENDPKPKWIGVPHSSDIEYVFGGPLKSPNRVSKEKDLSRRIQQFFTDFAKTGIPSRHWPPYTALNPVYIELNANLISNWPRPDVFGPRAEDCSFWNVELPRLRKFASGICETEHKSSSIGSRNLSPLLIVSGMYYLLYTVLT